MLPTKAGDCDLSLFGVIVTPVAETTVHNGRTVLSTWFKMSGMICVKAVAFFVCRSSMS
jgi:hypothetical protein